jgi:hypothetical protein
MPAAGYNGVRIVFPTDEARERNVFVRVVGVGLVARLFLGIFR